MADTNYTVLKERVLKDLVEELSGDTKVFVPIGNVDAGNGQAAIIKITEGKSTEEKNGDFAAPSTRNFPVIPRRVKMVEADSFGEQRLVNVRRPAAPAADSSED